LKKLKYDCTRKVCCTKIFRNGKYVYQKCKKGKASCPTKRRKWCKVVSTKDGCKRKRCCNKVTKRGKTVSLKCKQGRAICKIKRRVRCNRKKIGKCHHRRCCRYTWSYRTKKWHVNKTTCKYHKRCPNKLIKCKWEKLKLGCAERHCIKKYFKNKKVFRVKRWKNKKICFESRKFVCDYIKASKGCRIKNCCLTVQFEGKIISKRCRRHKEYCPTIVKRKCHMKKFKNGCSRKVCCVSKIRGAHVTKRCRSRRLKCPLVIRTKCKTRKGKRCSVKSCCKFRYIHTLKFWKKISASCNREYTCPGKLKSCKWQRMGQNCFKKQCCTTTLVNGRPVVGSTKCKKSKKEKCKITKKENVVGYKVQINVRQKDVVLKERKKEKY